MEITTLVQWNCLVYVLYYTTNIAFDYIRISGRQQEKPIEYSYQDLLKESTTKVIPSAPTAAKSVKAEGQSLAEQLDTSAVILEGPVSDQGIPLEEMMQNAKSYTNGMDF